MIAAVDGAAAGAGFSLALACDLIVAADDAKFVMSYARVGLTPDGGGSWFLAQALPRQLATEVLIEGKPIGAARLHELGVVNELTEPAPRSTPPCAWADELGSDLAERGRAHQGADRRRGAQPLAGHLGRRARQLRRVAASPRRPRRRSPRSSKNARRVYK